MIYLDASALVTFVTGRAHDKALREFLVQTETETATSTIGLIETVRTCDQIGSFPGLLARLAREHAEIPLTQEVRELATKVPGRLRALDAIHIASAQVLDDELTALVTYDKRMWEAARSVGLPVSAPGQQF